MPGPGKNKYGNHGYAKVSRYSFGPESAYGQYQRETPQPDLSDSFGGINDAVSGNLAAAMRVREQRLAGDTDIHGMPNRMIGGPAPDPRWDAFFGSLQNAQQRAGETGLRFNVDLVGRRGDGIGNGYSYLPFDGLKSALSSRY